MINRIKARLFSVAYLVVGFLGSASLFRALMEGFTSIYSDALSAALTFLCMTTSLLCAMDLIKDRLLRSPWIYMMCKGFSLPPSLATIYMMPALASNVHTRNGDNILELILFGLLLAATQLAFRLILSAHEEKQLFGNQLNNIIR